jgi:hypothetical protein
MQQTSILRVKAALIGLNGTYTGRPQYLTDAQHTLKTGTLAVHCVMNMVSTLQHTAE